MDVTAELERAALTTLEDAIITAFGDDDEDNDESHNQQVSNLDDYMNINLNEFHSLSTDEVEANLLNDCPNNDDDGVKSEEDFIGFNDDVILESTTIKNEQNAYDDNDDGDNGDSDNDKLKESEGNDDDDDYDVDNRNDMEKLNIKMEFTCESEKISENQLAPEYFLHNNDDENNEIEVYSTSQSPNLSDSGEENDELENLLNTSNDSMEEFLKFPMDHINIKGGSVSGSEEEKKTVDAPECEKNNLDENLDISSIMSDHNYTSQEINAHENTLRHNLINHILNKTTTFNAAATVNNNKITVELTEFVEKILESINTFKIVDDDNENEKSNINSKDEVDDSAQTYDDDDRDLFVQNIIDAVIAEDYAEYAESKEVEISSSNKSESVKKEEEIEVEGTDADIKKEEEIVENSVIATEELNEIIAAAEAAEAKETSPKVKETPQKAEETSQAEETLSKSDEILSKTDETLSKAETLNDTNLIDKVDDQLETTATENLIKSPDGTVNTSSKSLKSVTASKIEESETEIETDIEMQENCSEPLEHMQFEEAFDLLCIGNTMSSSSKSSENKLELLTAFAKALYNDCIAFATSKMNIDDKLQKYIKEQFQILKSLAYNQNDYIEQSQQTEPKKPKSSARKLRKLNKKNKKVLLESSSDSSSTDSSSSCGDSDATVLDSETKKTTVKKLCNKVKAEICVPPINDEALAVEEMQLSPIYEKDDDALSLANCEQTEKKPIDEYDDGVSLAKYIQSEIFEADSNSNDSNSTMSSMRRHENNDDDIDDIVNVSIAGDSNGAKQKRLDIDNNNETLNESDKENTSFITIKTGRKSKKLAESSDEEDENDKEIERLINLNALSKRQPTSVGSMKSADTIKKIKTQSQKSKNSIVDFSDDDAAGVQSNESMSEDEEEIITEEQYLARFNENLKQQLLHGSSSDSEEVEDDLNDVLDEVISDEDGNKSPLIDKFLKTYNVEESDEEENEAQTETTEESLPAQTGTSLNLNGVEENVTADATADDDKSLELKKSNLSNSPDNSDCELLNESLLFRKRTRPKTLEKMLSEADKRKKISKIDEDLISLSSESESSSGVEAVEEETNKSRILKPMLRQDQLAGETRKAQKHETDRIRRLEKKQSMMAKALKEHADSIKSGDLILDYIEETKTFIKVHPGIVKNLKKHQFEGVKFMYDSCYGGVEALKKNGGSGCILAHCMGLGKTLQLIALLHTVITFKELKTTKILVLCPKSTVMNWADEVVRWLGPINAKNLKVYTFNDTSDINEKISVMREWSMSNHTKAGCLLIGYEAFRTLVFYHSYKNRGNVSTARLEDIRDKVDKYLLQPGADLVVCDEGHIIKNSKSAISLAVAKIVTPKRIILTGTPIQNNLKEYYSMVNFIKPLFLGTEKEFANLYANPIKNGQHKDSNKRDIKVMKQRSFVLHKKLSKFVQRKEAALLKTFLPQKFEYVLFIPMTAVQNNLYEHILEAIQRRDDNRGKSLITDYTCLRKIWTHPKVLEDAWKNATTQKFKRDQKRSLLQHSDDDQPDDIYDSQTGVMSVTNDWWRHLVTPADLETILPSNKLRTMFEILRVCEEKGEKCLIFSAFVAVLNVVEYFFNKISDSDPETLKQLNIKDNKTKHCWISGQDYYRLDGKTSKSIRHEMVKRFNSPANKRARVFLISAKAGGQGINLVGANRVIILDTSWNPSNDQQNIFRIFRLGQKKNCYIYRVIAMGTMEEKVYSRSVTKQAMSFRVVDEQQIDRHYSMSELAELYTLTVPNYAERPMPIFPQDSILASLLLNFPDLVYKYHEHDSLLENKVEQELSEQEKADAWAAYEKDLQLSSEIRELPNFDDLQNNFAATSKMQNYLSSLPGFDQMQSFLNYGGLGQQTAALSPFMQSFLSQYNYSTQNQQYLEMYKRMAQSSGMGAGAYPDINSSLAGMAAAGSAGVYNSAAAAAAYTQSASKPPNSPSTASLLSSLHASGLSANPLSALGDLSMYGLGGSAGMGGMGVGSKSTLPHSSNPAASMSPHPSMSPHAAMSPHHPSMSPHHQYQQHQHNAASSLFGLPAPPTPSAANMNTNTAAASSLLSSFGQYKQTLENAFPNFSNYAHNDYQNTNSAAAAAAAAAVANKSKMPQSSNAHMNQYIPSYHHLPSTPTQAGSSNNAQSRDGLPSSSYSATNFGNASKQQLPPPPPAVPQSPTDSQSKRKQATENELTTEGLIRKLMEHHTNATSSSSTVSNRNSSSPNIAPTNEQPRAAALTQKRNNTPTQQMTTAKPPPITTTQQLQQLRPKTISPAQQPMHSKSNSSLQHQQHSAKSNTAMQQSGGASKSGMQQAASTKSAAIQQTSSAKPASVSNSAGASNASKTTPTTTQKPTGTSLYGALRGGANMFATGSTTKNNASAGNTSTVAPPLNMGILYPNGSSSAAAAASAELLKGNKEMQIIPTTNPPGPPQSISKFNELSPSISLTAVRQTTKQSAANAASAASNITTKQQLMQNMNLSNKRSNSNSSSNNSNKINKNITQAATATTNKVIPSNNKKSQNQQAIKQMPTTSMPSTTSSSSTAYNTASANLKSALAAAVVAKSSSSSSTSGNAKHIQPTNQKNLAAPFPTAIKKNIKKIPQVAAAQLVQNSKNGAGGGSARTSSPVATSVNTFYTTAQQASGSRSTVQPSANFRTIQKALTKDHPNRASPTVAQRPANSPIISQVQKRAGLNAAASVTTAAAAKAASATAVRVSTPTLASASPAAAATTKNSLNIRPVNIKQNPSGTGVYIIETNINQKKVAIGTPTKSGGGTTVTKVMVKGKRNTNDSKDISFSEAKRPRLE